jgi:hypothetical protein
MVLRSRLEAFVRFKWDFPQPCSKQDPGALSRWYPGLSSYPEPASLARGKAIPPHLLFLLYLHEDHDSPQQDKSCYFAAKAHLDILGISIAVSACKDGNSSFIQAACDPE